MLKYNDSLFECLRDLYPSVHLEADRFKYPSKYNIFALYYFVVFALFIFHLIILLAARYWEDKDNQKAFLDQFAQRAGFDPLIKDNWYQVTSAEVCRAKVCNIYLFILYFYFSYTLLEERILANQQVWRVDESLRNHLRTQIGPFQLSISARYIKLFVVCRRIYRLSFLIILQLNFGRIRATESGSLIY